ncbi:MAG TPA: thioredoxin family protein, partial [Humisphaera sp.]
STPCTFGLFVSVLGVAAAQPAVVGLLLVCSVGAGMAFPYVALSATPELARRFPRSGPWAEVVKQLMGFMLLGVAVFFAQGWVGRAVGPHNVWWVIFAVVAAGGLFLVAKSLKHGKTLRAPVVGAAVALLLIVPAFVAAQQLSVRPYEWRPYSAAALADARAKNKVVLVEFTASWCTNCHALEAVVLNSKDVQRSVAEHKVEMIRADLSDTDAPGWALLRNELQAKGVPLTVIYSPALPEPIKLTGIYGRTALTEAIKKASAKPTQTAMK